jgi:hypothetical protein
MSRLGSYKNTAFNESQKFLVLDPSTSSASLVLASELVAYITPQIGSVKAESTRLSAENTDYKVGEIIQTSGSTVVGSLASVYLVVAGGAGDFPMLNGNDLLVLIGDDALRAQLISQVAGQGASLVSMEGGPTVQAAVTVAETAILNRVIRVLSRTEMKAYDVPAGYQFSLEEGGRNGKFVFDNSNLSAKVTIDTQEGVYVAPNSDPTGANGAFVRIQSGIQGKWFGLLTDGTGATTNNTILEAIKNYAISFPVGSRPTIVWPSGIIAYSVSPNWGHSDLKTEGQGSAATRFMYSGAGAAWNVDPSAFDIQFRYGVGHKGFLLDCGALATRGLIMENIAQSAFSDLWAINGAASAVLFELSLVVLCDFNTCGVTVNKWPITSVHAESWRLSTSPSKGQATTACTFTNCVGEGASLAGWRLLSGTVNTWVGGTGEANSGRGVLIASIARANTFISFSLEANVVEDVRDEGQLTKWEQGYAVSDNGFTIANSSKGVSLSGMFTDSITIESGAISAVLENAEYNHKGTGTFLDNGTASRIVNLRNRTSGLIEYPKKARQGITVSASPFTHVNNTGRYVQVVMNGGTVTQVLYNRGVDSVITGQTQGLFTLAPQDGLIVSYSSAPNMSQILFGNQAI